VKASGQSFDRQVNKSVDLLDTCLENRYAKLITNPVLDFTEKSLDYWLPPMTPEQLEMNHLNGDNSTKSNFYLIIIYFLLIFFVNCFFVFL
jgi:hypothetical protein